MDNFCLDQNFLDSNTVTFYNSRESRGLVPFDWARKDWLVLACPGWNDASVASATGFISVFPGGKHNLITGLFCPETTKRYNL